MVGLCGSTTGSQFTPAVEDLGYVSESTSEDTYIDENISISISLHDLLNESQPSTTTDGIHIWVWGEIFGYEHNGEYHERSDYNANKSTSIYCADLYDQYGKSFIEKLNGEFCGILYEERDEKVHLFSDLLGSRPLYYITTEDGLLFATHITALAPVSEGFSKESVLQYLSLERVLGTKTPFEGISMIPPASIVSFDLQSGCTMQTHIYWRPQYQPLNKSFKQYLNIFKNLVKKSIADRTTNRLENGLLLSGGSDSRLILSASSQHFNGFHLNEDMNEEARIAKEVANKSNCSFQLLKRSRDHYPSILRKGIEFSNLNGSFSEGHTIGFGDEIRDNSDILLSGHWADTLYSGYKIPQIGVMVPRVNKKASIPFQTTIDSPVTACELLAAADNSLLSPTYGNRYRRPTYTYEIFNKQYSLSSLLLSDLSNTDLSSQLSNVEYGNLKDLTLHNYYYPLTTAWSYFFHGSMIQQLPYRNPFLDRRLIKLQTKIPLSYRVRNDFVNQSVAHMSEELAEIKRAGSNVSLKAPFMLQYFSEYAQDAWGLLKSDSSDNYLTEGSWPDHETLIRISDYVENSFFTNRKTAEQLPGTSLEEFEKIYKKHLDNKDYTYDIHSILTLIEHPATKSIIENNRET